MLTDQACTCSELTTPKLELLCIAYAAQEGFTDDLDERGSPVPQAMSLRCCHLFHPCPCMYLSAIYDA